MIGSRNKSKLARAALAVISLPALLLPAARAQCAPACSAVDVRGRRIVLAAPPRRIVSLTPGNTEILFALGLGPRLVGATAYCDFPAAARSVPRIGDYNTSVERVVARHPDLVVASASANSRAVAALERLHIRVFAVDPNTLAELYTAIDGIGRVTGTPQQAARLVGGLRARIAGVRRAVSRERNRPAVLYIVQVNPLWVAGTGNFVDDAISAAGGRNVAGAAGRGYLTFPMERALAARPDVILGGTETIAAIRRSSPLSRLAAVRQKRAFALGPEATRPCPRLVDVVEQIARILHPGAFRR